MGIGEYAITNENEKIKVLLYLSFFVILDDLLIAFNRLHFQ